MALAVKPKSSYTNRKRQAQHHQQSKHYLKAYWPYLPMLLIIGLGIVVNGALSHRSGVLGYATDVTPQVLLADTNTERQTSNQTSLSLSPLLDAAAQDKANDMANRNYWSHDTPTGQTPWSFMTAVGYSYERAGENLAYGFDSAQQTITAWMNSPEHRENLLDTNYSQVGFGVANIPDYQNSGPETLVVAFYAEPSTIVTASSPVTAQSGNIENISQSQVEPTAQEVARIQVLTDGKAAWSILFVTMITSVAITVFVIRHAFFWHRLFMKSEAFVIKHPFLDIAIVALGTAGILLSQTTGVTL